jgi:hypothetical protein
MLAVGLAGMAVPRPAGGRRELVVVAAVALAVACACWAPAAIDEVTHHPGNLSSVVRAAATRKATLGAAVGAHAVVRAVGVRPWWLTVPGSRWDRKHDVAATPSPTRTWTAVALLAALAAMAVAGAAQRRIDVATAALIGFTLCAALGAVAAETPAVPVLAATVGYTLWWGSQCGMWVWLVLAWGAWLALHGLIAARARFRTRSLRASTFASVAGLAAAALAGTAAAASEAPDQHVALYRPISAIAARMQTAIPRGRTVRLDGRLDGATQPFKPAVRFALARRGIRVLSRKAAPRNGDWYELDHRAYDERITLTDRPRRPPAAALLIRCGFAEAGRRHSVFVWLSRR